MEYNNNIKILIDKFVCGASSPTEENELLNWVKNSDENKRLFLQLQDEYTLKIANHPSRKTHKQWNSLDSKLLQQKSATTFNEKFSIFTRKALRYAAILVIGIAISGIYFYRTQTPEENLAAVEQTLSTPRGARSNFLLPDGSRVWLNAGSSLTFRSNSKKDRSVILNGEAYFEVEKNQKPFQVKTSFGTIQVLGTSFNVKAYSNDAFTATLEEGSIRISNLNGSTSAMLKPGQQASLTSNGTNFDVSRVNTRIYTAWREGILIFSKDPLEDIVKKLERWYNVDIQLTPNVKLKNYRFTGTIEMESLTEVLELIRVTAPIDYKYDAKARTVVIDSAGKKRK